MEQFNYGKNHGGFEDGVGYIFIRAVTDFMSPEDFHDKVVAGAYKNDGNIDIELTINGVSVPVVKVLESVWKSFQAEHDENVRKAAIEIVKGSKLSKLLEIIDDAEYALTEEIDKLFPDLKIRDRE